jgi:hypothetical protein
VNGDTAVRRARVTSLLLQRLGRMPVGAHTVHVTEEAGIEFDAQVIE